MTAALSLVQTARDTACCAALGCAVGAVRAALPAKGRAAFVPDMLEVGALLILLQSYTSAYSSAGALRWYMLAGGAVGAFAAQAALTVPLRAVRELLVKIAVSPALLALRWLLRPAQKWFVRRSERAKARREEKISAKMRKKPLKKSGHLLYNSNV